MLSQLEQGHGDGLQTFVGLGVFLLFVLRELPRTAQTGTRIVLVHRVAHQGGERAAS